MPVALREFTAQDYDAVIALWRSADGVTLRDADSRTSIADYLVRNAGLSFVAVDVDEDRLVGAVLCGTDGRRGYLQHMAVTTSHQRRGIGRALAERCLAALRERGILKCHLMVVTTNSTALAFWSTLGWAERTDIRLMSSSASDAPNA
jgi:ribosomal protein S18 acetylase RimI-like enzyme